MKLGLGIVIAGGYVDGIPPPFERSLYALHSELLRGQCAPVSDLLRIDSGKFPTDVARNEVVREALDGRCDALLFLDVDHVFEPAVIRRLLAADVDIITARYHVKKPPYHPNLYLRPKTAHVAGDFRTIHYGQGVFPVDRCGAGGLLVKAHVLRKMQAPWFAYSQSPHPPHDRDVTEDFYFCEKAQAAGFTIWADWHAEMGHITHGVVDGTWYSEYLRRVEHEVEEGNDDLVSSLVVCGYPDGYRLPSGHVVAPYDRGPYTAEEIVENAQSSTSMADHVKWQTAKVAHGDSD